MVVIGNFDLFFGISMELLLNFTATDTTTYFQKNAHAFRQNNLNFGCVHNSQFLIFKTSKGKSFVVS